MNSPVAAVWRRRYALFTLVGIAGEDDLDAPDLTTPTVPTSKVDKPAENKIGDLNGGRAHSTQQFLGGRRAKPVSNPPKPTLEPEPPCASNSWPNLGELTPPRTLQIGLIGFLAPKIL
jgi:hypothetical protein